MFTNVFRPVIKKFDNIKLWEFKVEGISRENFLGHPRVGNVEFKMKCKIFQKL